MQISRLFQIVYLLLEHKSMTARELAENFEVSVRTIYRDVDTLAQAGIPIYANRGGNGGIRLTENFVLNKSVLSSAEQKSVLASLRGMGALNMMEIEPVLTKLAAVFGTENVDWIEVDFSSWNPHSLLKERFELIKDAILTRCIISFTYSGADGNTQRRTVEPVKLVFRSSDWYLLGWCRFREDFRFFKLLRISDFVVSTEQFSPRAVKNLYQEEWENAFIADEIEVTVHIEPELSFRVYDDFAAEQRETQADGGFIVRFQMPGNDWLYNFLMSYGAGLQVIQPEFVRLEMIRKLKDALGRYGI